MRRGSKPGDLEQGSGWATEAQATDTLSRAWGRALTALSPEVAKTLQGMSPSQTARALSTPGWRRPRTGICRKGSSSQGPSSSALQGLRAVSTASSEGQGADPGSTLGAVMESLLFL